MFGGITTDEPGAYFADDIFLLTFSQDTVVSYMVLLFKTIISINLLFTN